MIVFMKTPLGKIIPQKFENDNFLVGAAGFEPTLAESESDVLPLNYAPMRNTLYMYYLFFQLNIFVYLLCIMLKKVL